MDCAFVDLVGSSSYTSDQQAQMWDGLPNIFVAQLSGVNSCQIPEGYDVVPPSPGPEVVYGSNSSLYYPPATWHCEVPVQSSSTDPSYGSGTFASSSSSPSSDTSDNQPMPLRMAEMQSQSSSLSTAAALLMAQYMASPGPSSSTFTTTCDPSTPPTTYVTVYLDEPCTSPVPITVTSTVATLTVTPSSPPTTLLTSSSSQPPSLLPPPPPPATTAISYTDPSNLSPYLPCVPGTFLCTSPSSFLTCDQPTPFAVGGTGWGWVLSRDVAAGMMCEPALSPGLGAGQMPGAPVGMYRDDRYVRAG